MDVKKWEYVNMKDNPEDIAIKPVLFKEGDEQGDESVDLNFFSLPEEEWRTCSFEVGEVAHDDPELSADVFAVQEDVQSLQDEIEELKTKQKVSKNTFI